MKIKSQNYIWALEIYVEKNGYVFGYEYHLFTTRQAARVYKRSYVHTDSIDGWNIIAKHSKIYKKDITDGEISVVG